MTVTPMFKVLPVHGAGKIYAHTPAALTTWTASLKFKENGTKTNKTVVMVGTNPMSTNTATTVTVFIVPIKMVYSNVTFDPNVDQWNGMSITNAFLNSPMFGNMDWKFGAVDAGNTQYIDAYQRADFWKQVGTTNTNYHVVLAPSTLTEQTINVGTVAGTNPISGSGLIGLYDINSYDAKLAGYIASFSQINPSTFVYFLTDNVYLTSGGGCCIGGYHSSQNNGQTYGTSTFVSDSATHTFSSDIGAVSHEFGEWLMDPGVPRFSSGFCGGIMENGDPLEGKPNFGTFPVVFNGVTYNPQNLVWISYFGYKKGESANKWLDTGHIETSVCQNGQ